MTGGGYIDGKGGAKKKQRDGEFFFQENDYLGRRNNRRNG
jgi:hypothetical protein